MTQHIEDMMVKNMKLSNIKKIALFTDIHLGRKNSSEVHLNDCQDYIDWFIQNCKKEKVDMVVFCGDWFEQRDAITGKTLDRSHKVIRQLMEELELPFFLIVGNHDLVYRNTRNAFNTVIFEPFENLILVDDNISVEIGGKKVLFCPYLFEEEYSQQITEINSHDVVFGHFEFKGFVLTGETKVLDHGPDHSDFKKPKRIFTGHFHKRQEKGNVHYIGNTFPMDYSDANDTNRGMAIYDIQNDDLEFIDWEKSPSYIRCSLSELLEDPKKILRPKASVTCLVDEKGLGYEDILKIKTVLSEKFSLRELKLEEPLDDYSISEDIDEEDLKSESTDEIVLNLLDKIKTDDIESDKLKKIYRGL